MALGAPLTWSTGGALARVPYNLEDGLVIRAKGEAIYFEKPQAWSPMDLVKSPMV